MTADEAYLKQLKEGHPAAYERLIERFEGPLYRFFFCDHHDHHVAQEQTAETFTQLVRSLPNMRGGHDKLSAYVFATARHIQQRQWRRPKTQLAPLSEAQNVIDTGPSPVTQAADREQLGHVLRAIGRLDPQLRNVLLLRFVEGYSIEEVAHALEMPSGTVKSHIHRGRVQLKQIFSEEECRNDRIP
jgi:RNA polymerase sigma-70 factor (ECF subfamily)